MSFGSLSSPIVLASRSPRRKLLLEQAGLAVQVQPADFDDGELHPGNVSPANWVMALAYLKAWRVADLLRGVGGEIALWTQPWSAAGLRGTVLGADTMCVMGSTCLGQPRDEHHARQMLRMMRNAEHQTLTGIALICLATGERWMFCDAAVVRIGALTDAQIEEYVASGQWRGKAGAYNLSERIDAGWPVECLGDPTTVMGLPMLRLLRMLRK